MAQTLKYIARCPCCKTVISERELQETLGRKINYGSHKYKLSWEHLFGSEYRQTSWACDDCLMKGKAIIGNVDKQLYLDYFPHFAYYDKEITCRTCNDKFVYTKEQQQFWYETLPDNWVQVEAVNCKKCRNLRKLNTELSNILKDKSKMSAADFNRVIEIYTLIGKTEKAKEYSALKKKLK
jgi:hypothetical protein